jgi:putative restriction endonuclease
MNPLERASVERAGYANGWENVRESTTDCVALYSARHAADVEIAASDQLKGSFLVRFPAGPAPSELNRTFAQRADGAYEVSGELELRNILRRAAELAMSLPNQAADIYAAKVADIEKSGFQSTEVLRMVKQRIGQDIYRQALIDYWSGSCAVTGLAIPELLRASHAKPWAKCESDLERLDVFNGFLLAAHLDALFDAGLMSFDDEGLCVFSTRLSARDLDLLALTTGAPPRLRWVSPAHIKHLAWHRENEFKH